MVPSVFVPSVQMGHIGHISYCVPPTSNDHNFLDQTPFRVFLDSMESPLSPDSFHVLWMVVGDNNYAENLCFTLSV